MTNDERNKTAPTLLHTWPRRGTSGAIPRVQRRSPEELGMTKNTVRRWYRARSLGPLDGALGVGRRKLRRTQTGTCFSNDTAAACGLRPARSARQRGGGCNSLTNRLSASICKEPHTTCAVNFYSGMLPTMGDTHATSLLCRNDALCPPRSRRCGADRAATKTLG